LFTFDVLLAHAIESNDKIDYARTPWGKRSAAQELDGAAFMIWQRFDVAPSLTSVKLAIVMATQTRGRPPRRSDDRWADWFAAVREEVLVELGKVRAATGGQRSPF
jgi:hypothetical protein